MSAFTKGSTMSENQQHKRLEIIKKHGGLLPEDAHLKQIDIDYADMHNGIIVPANKHYALKCALKALEREFKEEHA